MFFFKQQNLGKTEFPVQWNNFQDNIISVFGNLIEDNDLDFADVTLACEDSYQVEAHKVILDGSSPQTTIHTHCSKLEDLTLHPIYFPTGAKQRWGEDTSVLHINVIFLKIRNKRENLVYREEKIIVLQNLENREEKEKLFCKSWKSRGEREIVLQNLENRGEKEKFNTKILCI